MCCIGLAYDDEDNRQSELSQVSADLETQRAQLQAVLEAKKRELSRRRRTEKVGKSG